MKITSTRQKITLSFKEFFKCEQTQDYLRICLLYTREEQKGKLIFLFYVFGYNFDTIIVALVQVFAAFLFNSKTIVRAEAVIGMCYVKKGVLKNFENFTGNHLCQSLVALFKKRLWHRSFPLKFVKFLRTPFFI